MTEIQTRLLAERRAGGAVRERPVEPTADAADMPVLVNLFGTVERVAWAAWSREARHELREVGETLAFLRQPEPPRRPGATRSRCCRC